MEKEKKAASLGSDFDFAAFEKEAVKQLKSGKPLSGKEGVLTPLSKRSWRTPSRESLRPTLRESQPRARTVVTARPRRP